MADRRTFATTLAERTISEFLDDRAPQAAAAIAYHVLFSIFPLAIFLAGIFGLVSGATGVRADVVDAIVRNVPLSASGAAQLRGVLRGATSNLSALGLLGVVGLVWSASGMMASLRSALNEAWDVASPRPFLRGKLIDVGLVFAAATGGIVSLGVTIAVRVVSHEAASATGVALDAGWAMWILGVAFPLAYAFVLVFALYRLVPATEVAVRDVWAAALGVAAVLVLAQNLFALYVEHFANYNAVYGSLGAVIAFMFFVYLCASVFLLGAEAASEVPRVRAALERGEVEEGPPFPVQLRRLLRGLWERQDDREGDREETLTRR